MLIIGIIIQFYSLKHEVEANKPISRMGLALMIVALFFVSGVILILFQIQNIFIEL
jgi:hypothetical protein